MKHRDEWRRRQVRRTAFWAGLIGFAVAWPLASAQGQLGADAVKQRVEKEFGVSVLNVQPVTEGGGSAYAITVMNPGGSFNEAFQVNTIVVDAATGQRILQFRHLQSGISDAAPSIVERTSPHTAATP